MPSKLKRIQHTIMMTMGLCSLLMFVTPVANGQAVTIATGSCPLERPGTTDRPTTPSRPGESPGHPEESTRHSPMVTGEATGSYIILQSDAAQQEYWSEVEWVDDAGIWHVVDGWRGQSQQGVVRWFVEDKDFGKGPFRYHVYDHENGVTLGVSSPFHLPTHALQTVILDLELPIHNYSTNRVIR